MNNQHAITSNRESNREAKAKAGEASNSMSREAKNRHVITIRQHRREIDQRNARIHELKRTAKSVLDAWTTGQSSSLASAINQLETVI